MEPWFVDCHSHVCPSGDDGAGSVAEGGVLCREAHARGTALLFATPHVWPHLPLTAEREERVHAAFAALRGRAGLELRLGFELTPTEELLDEDPRRYVLEGTDRVLVEVPFWNRFDLLLLVAEHIEEAGLRPVIAHPERSDEVLAQPELAERLAERGWSLQVNATSLLGVHGRMSEDVGWSLLDRGLASIVASDGHRTTRPPHLDAAWAKVVERVGEERARPLFDGTALGVSRAPAGR